MNIYQFTDKNLAQFSYAIVSKGKMAVIDPARDISPYLNYARLKGAIIQTVFITHTHADFAGGHLELSDVTGAPVAACEATRVGYARQGLEEGETITLGEYVLRVLKTPGHTQDSISLVLEDKSGNPHAVFTGDTLFIGDCGRPDLLDHDHNFEQARSEQAGEMFHSLQKLMSLPDGVIVYPGHGAGSLCGKNISSDVTSTLGREKVNNWSLRPQEKSFFVKRLTQGQPHVPGYFGYCVQLNREGAANLQENLDKVYVFPEPVDDHNLALIKGGGKIIDVRNAGEFRKGHHKNSLNIPAGPSFETWLGSLVVPGEPLYLAAGNYPQLEIFLKRSASIGYEKFFKGVFVTAGGAEKLGEADIIDLQSHPENYTIIDVRTEAEATDYKFSGAINIPLQQIKHRAREISIGKPIAVHCASGFRSAVGSSLIQQLLPGETVLDVGEEILTISTPAACCVFRG